MTLEQIFASLFELLEQFGGPLDVELLTVDVADLRASIATVLTAAECLAPDRRGRSAARRLHARVGDAR